PRVVVPSVGLDHGRATQQILIPGSGEILRARVTGTLQEAPRDQNGLWTDLGRSQPAALRRPVIPPGPRTSLVPGCGVDVLALVPHAPCDPVLPPDRLVRRWAADDHHHDPAYMSRSHHSVVRLMEQLDKAHLQQLCDD